MRPASDDFSLKTIEKIKKHFPDKLILAGTVRSAENVRDAIAAGADMLVAPGVSPDLIDAFIEANVPAIPNACTPSEMMALADKGFLIQKFFPCLAFGGAAALSQVSGPLPEIMFCPSGVTTEEMYKPEILPLPNVLFVTLNLTPLHARYDLEELRRGARQAVLMTKKLLSATPR
jgi:2-dehydro-3-deoxyphosphogluconate aldolase / (4S)-4-hydroxy-2-oxoglutarate aldolase